jgi:phage repressor protein C with HTH and peptisase S24 domain
MLPNFANQDYVLISKVYLSLKVGHVVVVEHPEYGTIIKRLIKLTDTHISLAGDNSDSISSRQIGNLARSAIKGKLLCRIAA